MRQKTPKPTALDAIVQFIFPRRLHRLSYFLRLMALNVLTGFFYANSTAFQSRYWGLSILVLIIYALFFVVLPRIRDTGMSEGWLVVALIPVADVVLGLILLFRAPALLTRPSPGEGIPTTDGPTASGNQP